MSERKYFSVVTDVGEAAMIKAIHDGVKVDAVYYAVGDGGGLPCTPTTDMTALKNEVWRGDIINYEVSPQSPNVIRVDTLVPSDAGGFTMREMGIFDTQNRLIAVANMADVIKVCSTDGMQTEIALSMSIALTNKEALNFKIDTNLVYVSKKDLQNQIRQKNIIIPTVGWLENVEGGEGGVYIDVAQENITEKMIPIVSIFPSDMNVARACGMSTTVETINGAVRFFANKVPEKEIKASIVLLRTYDGIAGDITGGDSDIVAGMNIEEFYKNYVATNEEVEKVLNEVFKK